ncbi:unnamed protein product [Macrosiphum euphorbiae]|uniref:Uncharacterized protein n=1 Tax=Macrosiphum euphorbiae TaxID=13131 RepID=A0AAV0X087_9HEMI|nr:unnamed protein product [Macrosiphum euphorbiae]
MQTVRILLSSPNRRRQRHSRHRPDGSLVFAVVAESLGNAHTCNVPESWPPFCEPSSLKNNIVYRSHEPRQDDEKAKRCRVLRRGTRLRGNRPKGWRYCFRID